VNGLASSLCNAQTIAAMSLLIALITKLGPACCVVTNSIYLLLLHFHKYCLQVYFYGLCIIILPWF